MNMVVGKNNKIDRLNENLKIIGENLIDYSDNSNAQFQDIREHVRYLNKLYLKYDCYLLKKFNLIEIIDWQII